MLHENKKGVPEASTLAKHLSTFQALLANPLHFCGIDADSLVLFAAEVSLTTIP